LDEIAITFLMSVIDSDAFERGHLTAVVAIEQLNDASLELE